MTGGDTKLTIVTAHGSGNYYDIKLVPSNQKY